MVRFNFCLAAVLLLIAAQVRSEPNLNTCQPELSVNAGGMESMAIVALNLDQKLAGLLNEFGLTPGLAVGVVVDDQVVYEKGFGYRDLTTCAPVTADTGFYLLSVTKSFTGMLAAILQDQGKWYLDKSLGEYYPGLVMGDGINPNQISMRDLLVHRPGFRNSSINYRTFGPGNADDEAVLYLLQNHSEPLSIEFRYTNMGYVVAAMVMAKETGMSWQSMLEEIIFEPLGLTSTTTSIDKAVAGNFAKPYRIGLDGHYQPMPVKVEAQMHAAGGAVSNVPDLLRWIRINLAQGKLDGEQLIEPAIVRQVQAPQIQYDWTYYKYNRYAYGLGVHNSDYDGDLLIHHFGGPIHTSFMPEHDIGVVVLTNGTGPGTAFSHMIAAYIYDKLLEKPDTDEAYGVEVLEIRNRGLERVAQAQKIDADLRSDRVRVIDAADAASYAGRYLSDRLGEIEVSLIDGALSLQFGVLSSPMEFVGDDTFLVRFSADQNLEEIAFRGQNGAFNTLDWGGRLFGRVDP